MISFDAGAHRFHLRAAAVVERGDSVLLHQLEGEDFWSLPGGRVEAGEEAAAGVVREMREELGIAVVAGTLLLVVENFFLYWGKANHEVGLYFAVHLPEDCLLTTGDGPYIGHEGERKLTFAWFPKSELHRLDVRPSFLVEELAGRLDGFRHIVHHDQAH